MLRRLLRASAVAVALTLTAVVPATASPYTGLSDAYWDNLTSHRDAIEWEMVDDINASRARHGLTPLTVQADLRQVARDWSAHMRENGQYHNPNLSHQIKDASRWSENIWGKQAGGSHVMHVGFMESPGHRANILWPGADEVGVGLVFDTDDDKWWVTVNFRERRAGTVAAPEPARPPLRPAGRDFGAVPVGARIAGGDRIGTALALSASFDSADQVVLARSDEFADALSGGPLAAAVGGPLLLTGPASLDSRVADELTRLATGTVHLLGGTAALSANVHRQLQRHGVDVIRHAGGDRYATAVAAAQATAAATGETPHEVYVADGLSGWPDALAASAAAARSGAPLLLVGAGNVPDVAADAIATWQRELQWGGPQVTAVGGTAVISDRQINVLDQVNGDGNTQRLGGGDRYETSALAAGIPASPTSYSWSSSDTTFPVWAATGSNWPDALAAGPAAAAAGARLLLIDGHDPRASVAAAAALSDHQRLIDQITLVGGPAAISEQAAATLQAIAR